ncbi:HNH endonuclease [Pseudomonas aeruginosa]|uniref:HNH endonuclease n=1 Tax=Pseudomonas aeruginosa TaxID=287 RepID=UPI000CFD0D3C|nr:HNH endonuclease [Pseudomonas aeruginosa]MCZ7743491.1 HNH endonuclease [Pseudomonas aeruginosa]MCZ7775352.1 HNH endonuclease [Pseudomonas aeruginosa]MCZ7788341.1 HNH endonuclease [Pseudomonas aeruginosa]
MSIDWSKAPEGATHWEPSGPSFNEGWMKKEGNEWFYWGEGPKRWFQGKLSCNVSAEREATFEARPQEAWDGQGLPPVGTVCELQQEMKRIFSYDPETGCLRWKENQQKRFIGRVAGFITHHGYRRVNVGKTKLHAHQIIWLMHHGELPDCEIDHINGMRDDNRLENLRLANQQQNQQNSNVRIDNVLGVKGVRLRPSGNYQARVKLSDGSRAVKTFRTLTEAVSWLAMQREISHGEYANTPEQIAAEERRKSILHLANLLIDSRGQCNEYSQAEAIFDAGYRRQEEGK